MHIAVTIDLYNAKEMEAFNLFISKLDERRQLVYDKIRPEGFAAALLELTEPAAPNVGLRPAAEPAPESRETLVATAIAAGLKPEVAEAVVAPAPLYVEGSEVDDVTLSNLVRAHMAAKGYAETQKVIAAHGAKRATEVEASRRLALVKDLQCGGCGGAT